MRTLVGCYLDQTPSVCLFVRSFVCFCAHFSSSALAHSGLLCGLKTYSAIPVVQAGPLSGSSAESWPKIAL